MLELKPIELEDQSWIKPLLEASDYRGSLYSFGSNYIWGKQYHTLVGRFEDRYIVCAGKKEPTFLFPAGSSSLKNAIEAIMAHCEENEIPFRMHGILEEAKAELEAAFPGKFNFIEDRDSFDYIYTTESLSTLAGKKLHAKRNHINQFMQGNWSFEEITPENQAECLEMNAAWCRENGCSEDKSKQKEACAVQRAFDHYEALGFRGGLLRLDGKVVGYTMGEPLNSDTFVVHFEKAFADVRGAYPAVNNLFVKNCLGDFRYVNREEDMGIEGLRKAKLSYYPEILQTEYCIR
ncbi:MAG: DUF2156 domain-containing protein [Oscillospiraceae bacterium]|nr:DUF2156 domain-containing protein [Oscillospiraceae bacterium]